MSQAPASAAKRWLWRLGLHTKELRAWALYDCANSAFATTIMVAVLPLYYADVAAANLEPNVRTAYWGYTTGIAMVIIALLGPVLGTIADRRAAKKKFLGLFTILGILGTALLYGVREGDWLFASVVYIMGSIGFFASMVFYEALLPHIADDKDIHRASTAGYAMGYFAGGLLLALNLFWIMQPETFGFADKSSAVRASFLSVAVWWGLFSIPIFTRVKEPPALNSPSTRATKGVFQTLIDAFREIARTFREIKRYREAFLFLLAFWAFSDGIGTIMKMATIYGREVGIGTQDLITAILMVQFVGMPATFLVGIIADKLGAKPTLMLTLIVYTLISMVAYFMTSAVHFWILAGGVALVQGGAQALSRSLYATMIPRQRTAEFFGFYSFSSKFAGVIGPLFFGVLSQFTGAGRGGIIVVIALFLIGMAILTRVDVRAGAEKAQANPAVM